MISPSTKSRGPSLDILCVDDSSYNLFILKELLSQIPQYWKGNKELQLNVDTALYGQMAVEKVRQRMIPSKIPQYDLILMDLHMPVLNGFEAAQQLRSLHSQKLIDLSQTKIVAISAITKNQFQQQHALKDNKLFDLFCKHYFLLKSLLYSGKACVI